MLRCTQSLRLTVSPDCFVFGLRKRRKSITSDYVLIAEEGSGKDGLKEELVAEVTAMVNPAKDNKVFYKTSVYYGSGNYTYEWQDSTNGVDNWKKTGNEATLERDSRSHPYVRCKITDAKTGEVVYTPIIKNNIIAEFGPFSMVRSDNLQKAYLTAILSVFVPMTTQRLTI